MRKREMVKVEGNIIIRIHKYNRINGVSSMDESRIVFETVSNYDEMKHIR